MSEEALAFYRRLAAEVGAALDDLTVVPPRKSRSGAVRQRLEERLQQQREILQRLEQGQIESEQALRLIVEEQARQTAQSGPYGDYLTRLSESLRKLTPRSPGSESGAAEGPADD